MTVVRAVAVTVTVLVAVSWTVFVETVVPGVALEQPAIMSARTAAAKPPRALPFLPIMAGVHHMGQSDCTGHWFVPGDA